MHVYTQRSLPIFTTLDTAVLSSVHSYGARMWTKLKIDVERRIMVINVERRSMFKFRKTCFLSSILALQRYTDSTVLRTRVSVRKYPDSTISKVLKWRIITTFNRKLLEKQRVKNSFASYEVHIGHVFYNVNATVSFGNRLTLSIFRFQNFSLD